MEFITPEQIYNDPIYTDDDDLENLTPMKLFFRGKTVFITGGMGFLGQLYVEKLLRCGAKHIYLLGRAKKGQSPQERLKNTFCGIQFVKLIKYDKDFLKRISIVEGDMTKLKMGISDSDQEELIENTEIVIHAAADVRFNEKLQNLLLSNLRGTREILNLTSQMKNIKAFAFISTAFSHCVRKYIEERFYDVPVEPDVMIKIGEIYSVNSSNDLETITERIITPWPNTYTYTKALTEELVRRYANMFPICIIRPSICIATHEDPIPAWSNNIYGLNGFLVASGLGVLRLLPLNPNFVGDIVCADFVINSTLAALWVTSNDSVKKKNMTLEALCNKDPEIYNVCTSTDRPETWGSISKSMIAAAKESPADGGYWIPCATVVTNKFWFMYCSIVYHFLPAVITDIFFMISGKSLRVLPLYRKAQGFMVALGYFMRTNFLFDNSNMKRVLNRMTPEDREYFPSDVRRYNWMTYRHVYLQGLKVYLAHDSLDGVEKAKKKFKRLQILHYVLLSIYYGFYIWLFTFLADKIGFFRYVQNSVEDTYAFIKNPIMVY